MYFSFFPIFSIFPFFSIFFIFSIFSIYFFYFFLFFLFLSLAFLTTQSLGLTLFERNFNSVSIPAKLTFQTDVSPPNISQSEFSKGFSLSTYFCSFTGAQAALSCRDLGRKSRIWTIWLILVTIWCLNPAIFLSLPIASALYLFSQQELLPSHCDLPEGRLDSK